MSGPRQDGLPDSDARRRAATDFSVNLVVEAGAGTGKTSLLVERILNLVGSGEAQMSEIAAITFTERAAGELRQRVAVGLDRLRALAQGLAGKERPSEADRAFEFLSGSHGADSEKLGARALRALEELDRASLGTIHAFCSELLRGHPVEAGVEPDFLVDAGEAATRIARELWRDFLATELGPQGRHQPLWFEVLAEVGLDEVERIARRLAAAGLDPRGTRADSESMRGGGDVRSVALTLRGRIARLLEQDPGLTSASVRYFAALGELLGILGDEGAERLRERLAQDEALRRLANRAAPRAPQRMAPAWREEFGDLGKAASRLLSGLEKARDDLAAHILTLTRPYAEQLREALLRQGLVGFDELLLLARNLLRDRHRVRRQLKRRFRQLLVDEFQDTDPLQYEIVLLLGERPDDEADEAYRARLEPGRLFIVGDPKQSIYRFRGADYQAYRAAVERLVREGGQRLELTASFRCAEGLVEPVNGLFREEAGPWRESEYQPAYRPIRAVPAGPESDAPQVELWSVDPGEARGAEERRKTEARLIAEEIDRAVQQGEAGYQDFSVLLRSLGPLSHYLRALRERRIPFVVTGGRDFVKRPEVVQLVAAARALTCTADKVALLAFLRSPAGAVPDTELAAYAAAGGRWDWHEQPDVQRFPLLARRFTLLRRLSEAVRGLPPDAAIRCVLEQSRLLPLSACAFEGAQRVVNLQKVVRLAGQASRQRGSTLDEALELLADEELQELEPDSPLADDRAEAVRVSTIHAFKGLENAQVIVADLARETRTGGTQEAEFRLARTRDGALLPALRTKRFRSSTWVWLDEEQRLHEAAEEIRVLYVALTRARKRLLLLAGPPGRRSVALRALEAWGYRAESPGPDGQRLERGWVLHRRVRAGSGERPTPSATRTSTAEAVDDYRRALESARRGGGSTFLAPSEADGGWSEDREAEGARPAAADASPADRQRAVGTIVHRALAAWQGDTDDLLGPRLAFHCAAAAAEERLDRARLEQEARDLLRRFAASDLARRFRRVRRIGAEVPILLRRPDGSIYRGTIDLLYQEENGEWVIADYKTDRETDSARWRARYAPQLRVYAEAVQRAAGLRQPPRAEIWSIRQGARIPLD